VALTEATMASPAMTDPKPTSCKAPCGSLRIDDLVDAYINEARYRVAARELADHHGLRLRVLAELFGCDFKSAAADHSEVVGRSADRDVARDREQVASIARACLRKHTTTSGPFGFYMEGHPGPLEQGLLDRHDAKMSDALARFQKELRATFADCLKVLHPGIEKRKVPLAALIERGVPEEGPDPDEFW